MPALLVFRSRATQNIGPALVEGTPEEKRAAAALVEDRIRDLETITLRVVGRLNEGVTGGTAVSGLSAALPKDIGGAPVVGVSTAASHGDHVHRGVRSMAVFGNPEVFGDVRIVAGVGVAVTVAGNDIYITGPTFYDDVTPTPAPDGVTVAFNVGFTPNPPECLRFNVNGVEYIRGGAGIDGYSLAGDTVTMVKAPLASFRLRASGRVDP